MMPMMLLRPNGTERKKRMRRGRMGVEGLLSRAGGDKS